MLDITKIDEKKFPINPEEIAEDLKEFSKYCIKQSEKGGFETVAYSQTMMAAMLLMLKEPHVRLTLMTMAKDPEQMLVTSEVHSYFTGRIAGYQAGYKAAQEDDMRLMLMGAEEGK